MNTDQPDPNAASAGALANRAPMTEEEILAANVIPPTPLAPRVVPSPEEEA